MNISIIFLLLFFPLNSLLVFSGHLAQGSETQEDTAIVSSFEKVNAQVAGAKTTKKNVSFKDLVPPSSPIPIRKEGARDLVLPDAHASIILDADSGTILHYNDGRERRQIASLTKIMTAVLVMENVDDLNEEVEITREMIWVEGTRVGCPGSGRCNSQRLIVGEKISVLNLLKAMLMNSANDAALSLGIHVGGTEEKFVKMMNDRAKKMGLKDTNFCTPNGLEITGKESECYSTAYDVARITAHSLKFDTIWKIFRMPNNTIVFSADGKYAHHLLNTNAVLDEIPNILGGKTGFTPLAGNSFLMAVKDPSNKHTIVSVLLDDPYRWTDAKAMANWVFNSYVWE